MWMCVGFGSVDYSHFLLSNGRYITRWSLVYESLYYDGKAQGVKRAFVPFKCLEV